MKQRRMGEQQGQCPQSAWRGLAPQRSGASGEPRAAARAGRAGTLLGVLAQGTPRATGRSSTYVCTVRRMAELVFPLAESQTFLKSRTGGGGLGMGTLRPGGVGPNRE